MASESSFDVVSRVDQQELDNALNQARKEIENRFDFKNSKTSIEYDGKKITLISDDELKMRNVVAGLNYVDIDYCRFVSACFFSLSFCSRLILSCFSQGKPYRKVL